LFLSFFLSLSFFFLFVCFVSLIFPQSRLTISAGSWDWLVY
jgi:hypothetical protein